jgi:hypothetical protein
MAYAADQWFNGILALILLITLIILIANAAWYTYLEGDGTNIGKRNAKTLAWVNGILLFIIFIFMVIAVVKALFPTAKREAFYTQLATSNAQFGL